MTAIVRKDQLPPELREKYEASQLRMATKHPLYSTESHSWGKVPKGVEVKLVNPEHARGKGGSFSTSFVIPAAKVEHRTALDTSITRGNF